MAVDPDDRLLQLPDDMLKFVLESSKELAGPRLGRVLCAGRDAIATPHYAATTSRGVVPHVAHDMLQRHTNVMAVYMGLEDFVEKSASNAPILKTPARKDESALRTYTSLPSKCLSVIGPRRVPRISCPAQNTNSAVSISTSVGFRTLEADDYDDALSILKPDVSTSLVDLITADMVSKKRIEKSADRTHAWLRDVVASRELQEGTSSPLFASIPSLEPEQQQLYLQDLAEEYKPYISGVATYTPESVAYLPKSLSTLPRLCVSDPKTPQELLHAISLGVDLITVPLVSRTSELGLAFSFTFPPPPRVRSTQQSLAVDIWGPAHAASLTSLVEQCQCYTCSSHHRAYLHHLLQAKEMLAWTLLQLHNFHMLDRFFEGVRNSIEVGTFAVDAKHFQQYYEDDFLPSEGRDRGPRVRGYQIKSIGGDPKRNEKKWGRFENGAPPETTAGLVEAAVEESAAEESAADGEVNIDAQKIEKLGLAEKVEDVEDQ